MNRSIDLIAIDLGASVGRVISGRWNGESIALEEIHRFPNGGVRMTGALQWDVLRIWEHIQDGLRRYGHISKNSPASVGIDGWGVDFALLDSRGRLLANPYHYRDSRTLGVPPEVFRAFDERELFDQTGNQTSEINTLFQLYSMVLNEDSTLRLAHKLQMIPEFFSYLLTGVTAAELSMASTTQMCLLREHRWHERLLDMLELPQSILVEAVQSGTVIASVRPDVLTNTGLSETFPVVAVASHDTASAVAAIPELDARSAFISSGTWSLMGVEVSAPVTSDRAYELGFTNELGAGSSVLLMKNMTGLWLIQESMRSWSSRQKALKWCDLIEAAGHSQPFQCFIDPDHPSLHSPIDMPEAIQALCASSGQYVPQTIGEIARCCFESLSLKYSVVLDQLESLSDRDIATIRIAGGGGQNTLLCQMTANACSRPVVSGPVEASALGNIMVQAVAIGHIDDLATGRRLIAASIVRNTYEPQERDAWHEVRSRYLRLRPHLSSKHTHSKDSITAR